MPRTTLSEQLELAEAIAETLAMRVWRNDPADVFFILEDFQGLMAVIEDTPFAKERKGFFRNLLASSRAYWEGNETGAAGYQLTAVARKLGRLKEAFAH